MQSLLAGRLPFRVVVMIVVDMISIGLTPSNRIMSILPSSAGADGGLYPSHLCPYSSRFLFFFLAPFDVRPGPGYAWPRRGSWVPTLIRGLPSRGTPAKKNRRRSEKPCRCAWPLLQQRGAAGCFFPPPP